MTDRYTLVRFEDCTFDELFAARDQFGKPVVSLQDDDPLLFHLALAWITVRRSRPDVQVAEVRALPVGAFTAPVEDDGAGDAGPPVVAAG